MHVLCDGRGQPTYASRGHGMPASELAIWQLCPQICLLHQAAGCLLPAQVIFCTPLWLSRGEVVSMSCNVDVVQVSSFHARRSAQKA